MTMYEELRGDLAAWATHFHFNDETSLLLCKAADAIEDLSKTLDEEVEINTALRCNMPNHIPTTNADRIRAMSDEKLTKFLSGNCPSIFGGYRMHSDECDGFDSCQDCWMSWLKQECDDNGT